MYLARVLAGEYTKGRQGMITPPPKGSDATDVYDTVVDNPADPTIFVVFYDNQCYPDYLITFKWESKVVKNLLNNEYCTFSFGGSDLFVLILRVRPGVSQVEGL